MSNIKSSEKTRNAACLTDASTALPQVPTEEFTIWSLAVRNKCNRVVNATVQWNGETPPVATAPNTPVQVTFTVQPNATYQSGQVLNIAIGYTPQMIVLA